MTIGNKIIYLPETDSTNDEMFRLINQRKVITGNTLYTSYQTAGKGQQGNKWESQRKMNLMASIVFFPGFLAPENQFLLSEIVCLGINEFLEEMDIQAVIKWPNDILVNKQKICGTLIETALMGPVFAQAVVGIGLNVNQEAFSIDAPHAVSLKMLKNQDFNIEQVLNSLCASIDKWYSKLEKKQLFEIHTQYVSQLYLLNENSIFEDASGRFSGSITGIDSHGRLKIRHEDGSLRTYSFKEVRYI